MPVARALAPAKINVFLHVRGPRADGFHDLYTLFQALELSDEVIVRPLDRASRSLDVSGPMLPPNGLGPAEKNLAWRAAEEFQARTGWPRGFEIAIVKNIPVGGGLGGGSSDAAAVLRALVAMAPARLEHDPMEAAATLGSDVAFFACEGVTATASGRGEQLQLLVSGAGSADDPPGPEVVLVVPRFGIATADAYRWLRESGTYDPTGATLRTERRISGWREVDFGNTFERVVEPRFPALRRYRERLSAAGASIARLSGSGSTVFGLFEEKAPELPDLERDARVLRTRLLREVVPVQVQE